MNEVLRLVLIIGAVFISAGWLITLNNIDFEEPKSSNHESGIFREKAQPPLTGSALSSNSSMGGSITLALGVLYFVIILTAFMYLHKAR